MPLQGLEGGITLVSITMRLSNRCRVARGGFFVLHENPLPQLDEMEGQRSGAAGGCFARIHWMVVCLSGVNAFRKRPRWRWILGGKWTQSGRLLAAIVTGTVSMAGAQARFDADAVRLNNRGVALMGQQFTEKAEQSFAESFKKDPKLAQAAINDGIALLTLQKIDDAKKVLQAAIAIDPNSPQGWYNLGLAQHADNELDDALKSFQQAVKLDPRDVDSYYFEGVCYREMKQFDKAVEVLKQGIAIQPLHASSEFNLARALQAQGDKDAAKEHFKLFQHMTSTKISAAIGLAYGEQGHYSTVTPVEEPQTRQKTMIPVKLVGETMIRAISPLPKKPGKDGAPRPSETETGGACMLDVTGSGQMDLVLTEAGPQAIRVLHREGRWELCGCGCGGCGAEGFGPGSGMRGG